ncbi:MAG: poly(3-hydroxybutyrate) depolymerase [Candidatus Accumulibacter sp.]|jgi:poly(3-hydroxybutyrate) depolymerase|uniref:Poly(3-hydroxybutyrate) depolymerase n=1 Tax=Candidatus Accumulibacter affinis TaxID=2954384 RepID=A0A935W7A9_9PROT|nr:poly(3-hydroxybutyrate) depolymerase [Candidatus Accumulibacter affinis]
MVKISPARRKFALPILLAGCLSSQSPCAAPALPALGADLSDLTVSGVSSGAYMAVQFQVAHSKLVRGAGVIAGGPYDCADGSAVRAVTSCMSPSASAPLPSVAELRTHAEALARSNRIDPLENLRDDRAWLFSGGRDETVKTPVMDRLAAFYAEWLGPAAIRYIKLPDAAHAMISVADPQADACSSMQSPFINRCGNFDAAGEMLGHLLGPLQAASTSARGEVLSFDQRPFVADRAIDASLADEAYVYVPQACRSAPCRVHVAFHGCRQSAEQIGRRFIDGAGYNAWADNNRIIVLYPQTVPRRGVAFGSWKWVNNPFGCWDWWGYSGNAYPTRDGLQIKAVRAMVERLAAPRQP